MQPKAKTGYNLEGFSKRYRDRKCVGGPMSLMNHPNYISPKTDWKVFSEVRKFSCESVEKETP